MKDPNLDIEEVFDDPDYGEVGLENEIKLYNDFKWTIWENIDYLDPKANKQVSWDRKMRKVAWFDNIIQFHRAWNKISHSKIENVLFDIRN